MEKLNYVEIEHKENGKTVLKLNGEELEQISKYSIQKEGLDLLELTITMPVDPKKSSVKYVD